VSSWAHWCFINELVQAIPEIYVLDGKGIIRFSDVHGAALEKCAELLLREAKAES
jgi:hypothetical protein